MIALHDYDNTTFLARAGNSIQFNSAASLPFLFLTLKNGKMLYLCTYVVDYPITFKFLLRE